jgi:MFS family permease
MDRYGRRPLLMLGSAFMLLNHVIIAIMVGLYSDDWASHQSAAWISVAFLLFYMLAFGASWGPVPWAMPSEIFRSSLREKGGAVSTCSNWLASYSPLFSISKSVLTIKLTRMSRTTSLSG